MKKERKMKKFGFTRKILYDFHDFVSECVSGKSTTRFGRSAFFRRKVTIFIGRETTTHILLTKINEKNSPRSAPLTIIFLLEKYNHSTTTTLNNNNTQHNNTQHNNTTTQQHNALEVGTASALEPMDAGAL